MEELQVPLLGIVRYSTIVRLIALPTSSLISRPMHNTLVAITNYCVLLHETLGGLLFCSTTAKLEAVSDTHSPTDRAIPIISIAKRSPAAGYFFHQVYTTICTDTSCLQLVQVAQHESQDQEVERGRDLEMGSPGGRCLWYLPGPLRRDLSDLQVSWRRL